MVKVMRIASTMIKIPSGRKDMSLFEPAGQWDPGEHVIGDDTPCGQ